jgi:NAD(P)-dependent dehydrogenase (short-subunit alcohol dehydrogenase family)
MIAAGMLDGGLGRHLSDALRAQYLKHCSLKRLGGADEIARFAGWLALCNTYISGQALVLDGGL